MLSEAHEKNKITSSPTVIHVAVEIFILHIINLIGRKIESITYFPETHIVNIDIFKFIKNLEACMLIKNLLWVFWKPEVLLSSFNSNISCYIIVSLRILS